jgi:hypothetical protein
VLSTNNTNHVLSNNTTNHIYTQLTSWSRSAKRTPSDRYSNSRLIPWYTFLETWKCTTSPEDGLDFEEDGLAAATVDCCFALNKMVNHVKHCQNMSWVYTYVVHIHAYFDPSRVLRSIKRSVPSLVGCQTSNTLLECQSFIRGGRRTAFPTNLGRIPIGASARVSVPSESYTSSHKYSCHLPWTIPHSRTLKSSGPFDPLVCTRTLDLFVRHPWSGRPERVIASCQMSDMAHFYVPTHSVCSQP